MSKGFRIVEETPDRQYFTIIPNYIVNHSDHWEQSVYLIMKRMSGETGSCFFSQGNIANKLGISRPKVNQTIQKLIKRGWIQNTGNKIGMTKSVNQYEVVDLWKLNVDFYQKQKETVNHMTPSNDKLSTTGHLPRHEAVNQVYTEEDNIEEDNINTLLRKGQKTAFGDADVNRILKEFSEITGLSRPSDVRPRQWAHVIASSKDMGVDNFSPCLKFLLEDRKLTITKIETVWRQFPLFAKTHLHRRAIKLTPEQEELERMFGDT